MSQLNGSRATISGVNGYEEEEVISEADRTLMSARISLEIADLQKGKSQNAQLINVLCNNTSPSKLMTVGRRLGLGWGYQKGVNTEILKAEGMALIVQAISNYGSDVAYGTLWKALAMFDRIDELAQLYKLTGRLDEKRRRLIAATEDTISALAQENQHAYLRNAALLIARIGHSISE
jgi:hypothetical protein